MLFVFCLATVFASPIDVDNSNALEARQDGPCTAADWASVSFMSYTFQNTHMQTVLMLFPWNSVAKFVGFIQPQDVLQDL